MTVIDDAKGVLKTKQGKLIAIGAAGGLFYLYWTRGRSAPAGTQDTGDVSSTARNPGFTGGGAGGTTDGGGDGSSTRPATNQAWLNQAVSALTSPPYNYDSGAVYNALRLALDGLPITAAQQAIVSKAISVVGSPPEGMPPTNVTAPDASNPTPTPAGPTPTPAQHTMSVKAGWHVDQWINDVRRTPGGNPNLNWGLLELWNPGIAANVNWVKESSARTFKTAATYRINW